MSSARRRLHAVPLTRAAALMVCAGSLLGLAAEAAVGAPKGERVVRGRAEFARNGSVTTITTGKKAIINYQSFNIGSGETVQFVQPDGKSRVLNRISGADPTRIDGALLANGRVYIVNPAGVVFGAGSVVNVGAIHAAAGNITDDDFLRGIDRFTGGTGEVLNQGMITAQAVQLVGQRVANHGSIVADGGLVTMVSGTDVLIGERGGQIFVRVDTNELDPGQRPTPSDPGAPGHRPDLHAAPGVDNRGTIQARKGTVTLGAGDAFSLAVKNTGTIDAAGGRVNVKATAGAVLNAGTISTSVDSGQAGSIVVQAPTVVNRGEVRSDAQSGQAGRVELTSANHTILENGSVVSAAGGSGKAHGGEVLVHSYHGDTYMATGAMVDISGGAEGGHGGFAEVSARDALGVHGVIKGDSAAGYQNAEVLLDPEDIIISAVGADDAEVTTDGIINAPDGGAATFTISTTAIENFAGDVRLEATRDITILDDISKANGGFTLEAGRDIIFGYPLDPKFFTLDLNVTAHFIDFMAGRNIVDHAVLGTKLVSTVSDINLTATTGSVDFGLATTPAGRTFRLTQAQSRFFGAGPFGLIGNPTQTNTVVTVTDGWLILGGDFGGVSGFQNILSIDASATQFLRVQDDLTLGDFARLRAGDDVQVRGFVHAGTSVEMHAGMDGTGNVLFQEPGLDVWGSSIAMRAGNDTGLGLARADLITNAPSFRGPGGGATRPGTFIYQQDAAIADADIPNLGQFGAPIDGMNYRLQSNDLSVTISNASKVNETNLILDSQTGSFVNDQVDVINLDVFGPGILNADVTADVNQTYHGAVTVGGDRLLTADVVRFQSTVDGATFGNESLALAADVVFEGEVGGTNPIANLNVERTALINGQAITTSKDQRYNGAVTLGDHTELFSLDAGVIRFGSTLDSVIGTPMDLFARTSEGGLIIFAADVGATSALQDLRLSTAGADGVRVIPGKATIVGENSFTINSRDFVMGQHEKFTTLGSLTINASRDAVLGDLVTIGNMTVNASTITLLRRQASTLLDDSGVTVNDRGLDFVAGGDLNFNGTVVLGGEGGAPNPTFSDGNGSTNLVGFEVSRTPDGWATLEELTLNGEVLDQRTRRGGGGDDDDGDNPGESDALAGASNLGPIPLQDSIRPEVFNLALANSMGLAARAPSDEESAEALSGRYVYDDATGRFATAEDPEALNVAATRVDIQTLIAMAERSGAGNAPGAVDGNGNPLPSLTGAAQAINASARSYMTLNQAGSLDADSYRTFLAQTPGEAEARQAVAQVRTLLQEIDALPLTPNERLQTRSQLLTTLAQAGELTVPELEALLAEPVAPTAEELSEAASATKIGVTARTRDALGRFATVARNN